MTKVKICGIREVDNALMVAAAGADMIGLNFYPKTPRYVSPTIAREIASALEREYGDARPVLIGVFVNEKPDRVRAIMDEARLDFAQLSGDESPATLSALAGIAFKALRPASAAEALEAAETFAESAPDSSNAPSLLADAYHPRLYGGTGETASLDIARALKMAVPRLMLAGGLNPDNVAERVRAIQPWAVDVASGVEAGEPGRKDRRKVQDFIAAARSTGT